MLHKRDRYKSAIGLLAQEDFCKELKRAFIEKLIGLLIKIVYQTKLSQKLLFFTKCIMIVELTKIFLL